MWILRCACPPAQNTEIVTHSGRLAQDDKRRRYQIYGLMRLLIYPQRPLSSLARPQAAAKDPFRDLLVRSMSLVMKYLRYRVSSYESKFSPGYQETKSLFFKNVFRRCWCSQKFAIPARDSLMTTPANFWVTNNLPLTKAKISSFWLQSPSFVTETCI